MASTRIIGFALYWKICTAIQQKILKACFHKTGENYQSCNVLLGGLLFKHKLGTPTFDQTTGNQRAESGTVEELLQTLDNSKLTNPIGMAYFYSTAPFVSLDTPDFEIISNEWKRLEAFKKTIASKKI